MTWYADAEREVVDLDAVVVDGVAAIDIFKFEVSGGGLLRIRWASAGAAVHPVALREAKAEAQAGPVPEERETIPTGGTGGSSTPVDVVDPPPANPHPDDDEFDGKSTVVWVDTPTPAAAHDLGVTRKGNLHINGDSGQVFTGRLRPLGSTFPITITAKVNATTARGLHQRGGGILITEANPTAASPVDYFGVVFNTGGKFVIQHFRYTFDGTIQTYNDIGTPTGMPLWLRLNLSSDTSATAQYSNDGTLWSPPFALPGFNYFAGAVGLGVANEGDHSGGVSALFEYLRSSV